MMSSRTEQVWKRHREALHGFIVGRINDPSVAEDLLQEVFVRVHARIGTLKDEDSLKAWLYQIARNAIIDHYRSERRTSELTDLLSTSDDQAERSEQEALAECVLPFVEQLPEPYREAVMLSEIEGMSQVDLAKKPGLSPSGAKSRVQRGRAKIKEMLLDCCEFEFDSRGTVIGYERREPCDCEGC